jgi:5'-AMP-activated protein kinase regulatory beta subunit
VLELKPGTHKFCFIVDNEKRYSLEYPTVLDSDGNLVNYIEIPESGIKPFELEENEEELKAISTIKESLKYPDTYSQIIPSYGDEGRVEEPPILPPHLGTIVLNREPPPGNDQSVLLVPHHVSLHHLYALSIRDNVMVIAVTCRYEQKYVTVVYYKHLIP